MGLSSALPDSIPTRTPSAGSNLAGGVASLVSEAANRQEQNPATLRNFQLIQPLLDLLKPMFDALGLAVAKAIAKPSHGSRLYEYTTLAHGDQVRHTLHIPNWILDTYNDANYDALSALAYAFMGKTLFIFSEKVVAPQLQINQLVFRGWRDSMQIQAKFVSWRHIEELSQLNEGDKKDLIKELLELGEMTQPQAAKLIKLDPQQKAQLIDALSEAFQLEEDLKTLAVTLTYQLTTSDNLRERIMDLVTWFDARDRVGELVTKACEVNATNKRLSDFKKSLQV